MNNSLLKLSVKQKETMKSESEKDKNGNLQIGTIN
jgi:hypothetical protein